MIRNNTKWVDIPFFLTKNEYTNDINLIKDSNAIRSSIKNIIATIPGERPFNPKMGSRVITDSSYVDRSNMLEKTVFTDEIYRSIYSNDTRVIDLTVKLNNTDITITDKPGILAKAKIKDVNRYGSITNIEVLESGINYSANTTIDPGYPTVPLTGTYVVKRGQVTVTFPSQHGIVKGKNISVYYTGNVFSPIDNTSHTASIISIPDARSIRYRYPGF